MEQFGIETYGDDRGISDSWETPDFFEWDLEIPRRPQDGMNTSLFLHAGLQMIDIL